MLEETKSANRSPAGQQATEVILAMMRANGLLLAEGDRMAGEHGLTAARWQVLGAAALSPHPLTVPQIARRMGISRQTVHATVSRLVDDGLVKLLPNADHRRSQLVSLTDAGRERYAALDQDQIVWVNQLAGDLEVSDLARALRVIDHLCQRLETH